jgi:hypothetical protein
VHDDETIETIHDITRKESRVTSVTVRPAPAHLIF